MIRTEGSTLRQAIVVPPNKVYITIDDLTRHNFSTVPNLNVAKRQHEELCAILEKNGVEVIKLNQLKGHPNSVFARDPVVITPLGAIILSMGLESRRGEEDWIRTELERLDIPIIDSIKPPGTVEGGDIILAGNVIFVGLSTRTNTEGIEQITSRLIRMRYRVRTAKIPSFALHLGGVMSVVAPDRVLCVEGVFPTDYFQGFETISVPQTSFASGNVITIKPNVVIAEKSNTKTVRALQKAGVTVHEIDLSEFSAGTGGPSCLILPVRRA